MPKPHRPEIALQLNVWRPHQPPEGAPPPVRAPHGPDRVSKVEGGADDLEGVRQDHVQSVTVNESLDPAPVELFALQDPGDVDVAEQRAKPVLVEMDQEVDERGLRVKDSDLSTRWQVEGHDALPDGLALAGSDPKLEEVEVEIDRNLAHTKLDRLQASRESESLDLHGERMPRIEHLDDLACAMYVIGSDEEVEIGARSLALVVVPARLGGDALHRGYRDGKPIEYLADLTQGVPQPTLMCPRRHRELGERPSARGADRGLVMLHRVPQQSVHAVLDGRSEQRIVIRHSAHRTVGRKIDERRMG